MRRSARASHSPLPRFPPAKPNGPRSSPGGRNTGSAPAALARIRCQVKRETCLKPWTVLVYMAADNDTAPIAARFVRDGRRLCGKKKKKQGIIRGDLVVWLNLAPDSLPLPRFQSPKVYHEDLKLDTQKLAPNESSILRSLKPCQSPRPQVESPRKTNSATFSVESRTILEHYLVILWGHGQGWAPGKPTFQLAEPVPRSSDLPLHAPSGPPVARQYPRRKNLRFAGRKFGGLGLMTPRAASSTCPD